MNQLSFLKARIGLTLAVSLLTAFLLSSVIGQDAFAASTCDKNDTIIIQCGDDKNGAFSLLILVINILSIGVGVLAVGGIVYGAIMWTTAEDKADQVTKAKTIITNVVIGLVVYLLIFAGLQFLLPGGAFNRTFAFSSITNTTDDTLNIPDGGSGSESNGDTGSDSSGRTFKPSEVLIIGDSITAKPETGTNQGNKGWWEYLLAGKTGRFKFSAQNGSGYVAKGNFSNATTFFDRLDDIDRRKPKAIVIAGGINDGGKSGAANGIEKYYTSLAASLTANQVKPTNVYVFVPRLKGTAGEIPALVKSNAARIGVNYVDVGSYTGEYDGLHPTTASAQKIYDSFKISNFDEKLLSEDATPGGNTTPTTSLTSVTNFREAGAGSGVIKAGTLYRSAQLNKLTNKDSEALSTMLGSGATIIDIRSDSQRGGAPDKPVSGTTKVNIPIQGILDTAPMVTDSTRRAQVAKTLRTAGSASGKVLVHCVSGKDRTGWTVAMIMYANGASDQQVMTEYLKSNAAIPGGVKAEWLTSGVQKARDDYGSVTGYLQGIGLSQGEINKLKSKFGA